MYVLKKQLIPICIVILLLIGFLYIQAEKIYPVFLKSTNASISEDDVNIYFSLSSTQRGMALQRIAQATMKNLNLDWNNERIKTIVKKGKLTGSNADDLIVAISLLPDKGSLCIYRKSGKVYEYFQGINDLVPINEVEVINSKNGNNFIYLEEELNEKMGAFYKTTLAEMYGINGSGVKLVFSANKDYEADWNEAFDNKKNPSWLKLTENSNINISDKNNLRIVVTSQQKLLKSKTSDSVSAPQEEDFKLVKSRTLNEVFYWEPKLSTFIMGKALVFNDNTTTYNYDGLNFNPEGKIQKGEVVNIIDDMANNVENLAQDKNNYIMAMTNDGKIIYLLKDDIKILK
ncbi:hypothetical protein SAMN02746089_00855 [Caldanaerobius fijiensis DSM 17918]|uniref:Uncharacterized protein n=1 Tax=Caldanaerobius fijiensis DSM 17918 TaxID=1121256 RepID=A0A1M4WMP6_9THEO|nr:hypothetical protein [Caldanaerobius fijiensis]SHE82551.1 hypothetical protein SAMN02746089_00855 [Caldanaerobius fijiensis DSM 17918]